MKKLWFLLIIIFFSSFVKAQDEPLEAKEGFRSWFDGAYVIKNAIPLDFSTFFGNEAYPFRGGYFRNLYGERLVYNTITLESGVIDFTRLIPRGFSSLGSDPYPLRSMKVIYGNVDELTVTEAATFNLFKPTISNILPKNSLSSIGTIFERFYYLYVLYGNIERLDNEYFTSKYITLPNIYEIKFNGNLFSTPLSQMGTLPYPVKYFAAQKAYIDDLETGNISGTAVSGVGDTTVTLYPQYANSVYWYDGSNDDITGEMYYSSASHKNFIKFYSDSSIIQDMYHTIQIRYPNTADSLKSIKLFYYTDDADTTNNYIDVAVYNATTNTNIYQSYKFASASAALTNKEINTFGTQPSQTNDLTIELHVGSKSNYEINLQKIEITYGF